MKKLNILPSSPEGAQEDRAVGSGRFPSWLHRKLPSGGETFRTNAVLTKYRLNTVCEEAKCPNRLECYTRRTAAFLALGKVCTRNCSFCDIDFSKQPLPPATDEPERIALSVRELGLRHAVITMVARDDLPDQGASQIAAIARAIRKETPETTIELLTSDFSGEMDLLDIVLAVRPEVFNHNIETVRILTPRIRHKAGYERTLSVLRYAKSTKLSLYVKSGIMLGFGENDEEARETIRDLFEAGCDVITIGQYLQASSRKLLVKEFVTPERFKALEEYGLKLGVRHMYCGPFVRSSYNANLFVPGKEAINSA